jgi:hypothetical protein
METRQQRLIRQALEHDSDPRRADSAKRPDPTETTTLRDQALKHIDPDYVPRTLTPHEWEAYYARVGVPRSHRRSAPGAESPEKPGLLRRLLGLLPGSSTTESVTRR